MSREGGKTARKSDPQQGKELLSPAGAASPPAPSPVVSLGGVTPRAEKCKTQGKQDRSKQAQDFNDPTFCFSGNSVSPRTAVAFKEKRLP